MNRREFFRRAGAAASLGLVDPRRLLGLQDDADTWRTFEIVTRVEVRQPTGPVRVWLPTPLAVAPYQKTMGDNYHAGGGHVVMIETTNENDPDTLGATWDEGVQPVLTLTSRVMTRDHGVDLATPAVPPVDIRTLGRFLRPTRLIPTDGIVKTTADTITQGRLHRHRQGARDLRMDRREHVPRSEGGRLRHRRHPLHARVEEPRRQMRRYQRALRRPRARRRAAGARCLRAARRALGKGLVSLGLNANNATKAQHCRAEVYLVGYGWVPVDPADVRKVALEEPPGNLTLADERVKIARARLFGSWEMNWIAYNFAHDVTLRGAKRGAIPFFMYPQGETDKGRLDSLDPDNFSYSIAVSEIRK